MKIIASTGDKAWLFEATSEEIAQIQGFGSTYSSGFDQKAMAVGKQFNVGQIYKDASDALAPSA